MKILSILIILSLFIQCNKDKKLISVISISGQKQNVYQDSFIIAKTKIIYQDSIIIKYKDSLYKERHSIENFDIRFKLAKIERYATICNKNPSQKVFLLGWINRTLKE